MAKQRYVSNELTHFVGRRLGQDACYELLKNVLTSGWLMHAPFKLDVDGQLTYLPNEKLSQGQKYQSQVVCFCDIPIADLQIHQAKYSRFGLSFTKNFLTKKGANPVFYMAKNSMLEVRKMIPYPVLDRNDPRYDQAAFEAWVQKGYETGNRVRAGERDILYDQIPRSEYFDSLEARFNEVMKMVQRGISENAGEQSYREQSYQAFMVLERLAWELRREVFSFMKFFDADEAEDHPDNYYMEREWRKWGNLQFALGDVHRVILPKEYISRFRQEIPDFLGQITFSEFAPGR